MQNGLNKIQLNFSGMGCWLFLFASIWLLGAAGLGWLVKSVLVLVGLIALAPVLAFLGFRFWLKRNLVEAACPVCRQPLTGLAPLQTPCPSCGTLLKATPQGFERVTPEGTIDVQAVDVQVMDTPEPDDATTITVEVQQLSAAEDAGRES
jgi:hypothetical protein